ncbi:MAG: choice-of-anchor L domain-containing protein, partial [Bacteroidetes bacterium]|nr:choice-of-anchor L domain-containing protein [Bacteroidota bacterium]
MMTPTLDRPLLPILRRAVLAAIAVLGFTASYGQLTVNSQTDLQQLARTITGSGVAISNPQITCHSQGYGEFRYTGSLLGIPEGILLTTGKITNAIGPNDEENTTFQQNTGGDNMLNTVTGRSTKDACKFEFDIIPAGDSLKFDFVMGSEEYNEWVGSQYNDVFGFFISGPGITGDPGIGSYRNIALVPGTQQAVTINNVNNGSNASRFYDNAGGQHIQYDGFTRGLSARSVVQPCQTYHLKLVVADATDRKFDTGVFIAKVKSNAVTMQKMTQSSGPALVEGCNNGWVRFTRQNVTAQPLALQYYLQGSATNGTDYVAIGAPSPLVPKTIVIPANQAYVDQPVTTIADGLNEGTEQLIFILGNPNCAGTPMDSLVFDLLDTLNASVQPPSAMICRGDSVQFHVTGGQGYAWSPATGLSAANVAHPWARPASTTTYTVTVSEGACTRTMSRLVKVSQLALSAAVTQPLCAGSTNGALNLNVSNGIAPYTIAWTGPNGFTASTEDLSGIAAGTYTVTVTDAVCSRTQSFNVAQPAPLSVSLAASLLAFGQNISCHNGNDGAIDATVNGGTAPYSASWTGPNGFTSLSIDINGLRAGTYTLQVTDAHGCTASASTTLIASSPMTSSITAVTDVACQGTDNGSATMQVSGGMPPYSYSWNTSPAQTTATASGLAPGSYTVIVRDLYGCTTSASAMIAGPLQPLTTTLVSKTDVRCFGNATGAIGISASGGTAPYAYAWNTTPVQTTPALSGLVAGTYTVTVTDAHDCSTTRSVTITQPAQPLSTSILAQQHVGCFGNSTGSATVTATGGAGPYAYAWNTSPVQHSATGTGLAAGTYVVTVTDVNTCTATQAVTITQPAAALGATIGAQADVNCNGGTNGTATVNATGGTAPYTYAWSTTPAQTAATATGLGSGTWTATVTDAGGCGTTATATITQPDALAISGSVVPALCQGASNGAVDATVTGGTPSYTYAWSGPNAFTASTPDISGVSAGGYTLTVTDGRGCIATQSFDVNQPGLFAVNATIAAYGTGNVRCIGSADGSIALDVSGATQPYTYAWSGPSAFASTDEDITGLAAGTYAVSISDANGCSTHASYVLAAPAALTVQLTPSHNGGYAVGCNGGTNGTITTTVGGGNAPYGLSWSGPGGFSSTQQDLSGLAAGTYTLTVTDANGCSTTQSITLTAPPALSVTTAGTVPQSCFGSPNGQATVNVTGGTAPYTYDWATVPVQHGTTATGLVRGTYAVTVRDANGCSASTNVMVDGPTAALAVSTVSVTNVACHGGQTGAATVLATGGTAPYTYAWNTSPTTNGANASGLGAGTWTVTVTDARGCNASRNIAITQPAAPLSASVVNAHDLSCFGNNDGSVSIAVSGGSGSYAVQWNTTPVQSGATATGLTPGTYTATIQDNNGCTQALSFPVTIGGPTAPLAIATTMGTYAGGYNVSCPGASNGSINATVTGGTAPYTYAWTDGYGMSTTLEDLSALAAGTYHLTVTDAHGCQAAHQTTLTAPPPVTATATIASAICHGESNGAIDLTAAGGAVPYAYSWTSLGGFTSTAADLHGLPAGVYTVAITDANGCSSVLPFDVTEPGTFSFSATLSTFTGGNNVSCAPAHDGAIAMTASGGTAPYQYHWIGPNAYSSTDEDPTGLAAGTYHLTLVDANGCSALSSHTLTAPTPVSLLLSAPTHAGGFHISCRGANDGAITPTVGGGIPGYTYQWTGPNGLTSTASSLTGLAAGTYALTAADANGCSTTASITLTEPPTLAASLTAGSFANGSGISCDGASDGTLLLSASGGTQPFLVSWAGPNAFASSAWQITGLEAGTYTATVTDGNGCTTTANTTLAAPAPLALSGSMPTISGYEVACHGGHTGAIDLSVTGGAGGTTYQWSGPNAFAAATQDIANAIAGTYTVTVSDRNGCRASQAFTLNEPAPLAASAAITTAACQGANTGAIDLSVTGGVSAYSYLWSGLPAFSATTEDIAALYAGVYAVTITDANGCALNTTFDVGQPGLFSITADLSSHAGGYNISCPGADDGSIDATITGGTAPYGLYWTGPAGFSAITEDIAGLMPGPYTLSVTDVNGCGAFASYTLIAPTPIAIGLSAATYPGGANTSCGGSANGSIDATISGGVPPYAIDWTGPNGSTGITEDLSGLTAGTYIIHVTDAIGCGGSDTIVLSGPAGLSAQIHRLIYPNGFYVTCADASDGSIDLTINGGTAPYTIAWTGPNGFHASTEDISGLAKGDYNVTITDVNGCMITLFTDIKAPLPLVLDLTTSEFGGGVQVSCPDANDGMAQAGATGGTPAYSFAWIGPAGFTSSQQAISDLGPGTYAVTVTDLSGCSMTASATLHAPQPLIADHVLSDAGFGYQVGCSGNDGSIAITITGGIPIHQFDWTGPNGFASQAADLHGLIAGTYDLTVTDANGCHLAHTVTLTAPDPLHAALAVASNECDLSIDGAIDLTVTGGVGPYGHDWSGPNGFTSTNEDLTALPSGAYTVAITDAMGCTTTATGQVIAAAPIALGLYLSDYASVNIPCVGASTGVIELAVDGGFAPLTIAWSGPDGFTSDATHLTGLTAGDYQLTITDDHGCTVDSTVTLTEPATALNASLTAAVSPSGTNIACHGGSNGAIDATVIGGEGPYDFAWRGPDSTSYATEDITALVAGTYELVITDANHCTVATSIVLTEPATPLQLAYSTSLYTGGVNTSCAEATDGAIGTTVSGGSPAYTLAWTGPGGFTSSADTLSGLAAGTYAVAITDINGCVLTQDVVLT